MRPSAQPHLRLVAAAAASLCAGMSMPALAQSSPGEQAQGAQLQTVEVSARRSRENPQTVPISINAFTEDALEREDVRTTTDLERNIPGLSICCGKGRALFNFVRGIQGIQAYFAETPLLSSQNGASSLSGSAMYFDLDNLAVLKGPQGTLFGVSTNGGAMLFAPRKAGGKLGGYVGGEVGDYNRRIVEGVLNVPVNDVLSVRVGVKNAKVDGYVKDLSSGNRYGDENYTVGRLAVNLRLGAGFENDLFVNYYKSDSRLAPFVPVAVNPSGAARGNVGPALDTFIAQQNALGYYQVVGSSLPADVANKAEVKQTNVANITSIQLNSDLTLKNVLGFSRLFNYEIFDADGTPFKIYDNNVPPNSKPSGTDSLLSEELQLQGKALGGRLSYTTGAFYAKSKGPQANTQVADLTQAFGIQLQTQASSRFETTAAYAQATYDFVDQVKGLKATAGYRYTEDKRWLDQSSATLIPSIPLTLPNADLHLASKSTNGSYTLGLTYEVSKRTMVYLTNSKGFLNGGFNTSVTNAADAPYGPESLNNFELGIKSDTKLGDVQLRSNVAAYYGLYKDAQVSVTTVINQGTAQQAFAVLTKNAAEGKVRGVEWSFTLVPSSSFELAFIGSYMSNRYTRFSSLDSVGNPVDLSSTPFTFTPKLKYGLSATVYLPIGDSRGELSLSGNYTHQDAVVTTSTVNPQFYDRGPAFNNLNVSLNWMDVMGRKSLDASFFVNNATNNKDANGGFGAYGSLGVLGYTPAAPRMMGLRLKQAF